MKSVAKIVIILLCLSLLLPAMAEGYTNPIIVKNKFNQPMNVADPYIFRFNGKYYLYPTGASEVVGYVSDDLVNWQALGNVTKGGKVNNAYAPEVFYYQGDFYMICSPKGNGHYILKSDSPAGPFQPVTGNFGYSIDGSLFVLDNGELWMLHLAKDKIWQVKIDEETMTPTGESVATGLYLNAWTEGPGLIRRGEWNFITYTGNHYLGTGYKVCWASNNTGLIGAYNKRADSSLLVNAEYGESIVGIGHSANVYGPDLDSIYCSYHVHDPNEKTGLMTTYPDDLPNGFRRRYSLDRLLTNGGYMYSTGPSDMEMPVPEMPEAYADLQEESGMFFKEEAGAFALVQETRRFTQECNFIINEAGAQAIWQLGEKDGLAALLVTDGETIQFKVGETVIASADLPELGRLGRIHGMRVEHSEDVMYVSIDSMRVLTVENPGITARKIGAVKSEGADYSFVAHTGRVLGDGDRTALKTVPGKIAAVHCLPESEIEVFTANSDEEQAIRLGAAYYPIRVEEDGKYRFDLTVPVADAGKKITFAVGDSVMTASIPSYGGEDAAEWFTFTSPEISLSAGDHTLSLSGDNVALLMMESYKSAEMPIIDWDFTGTAPESAVILGDFKVESGMLSIPANAHGMVTFGLEGCTDYEMQVAFAKSQSGTGQSGILIRATDVSLAWWEDRNKETFYGYAICPSATGVTVRRVYYGSGGVSFKSISGWSKVESRELVIRVQGNVMTIGLPGADTPVLTIEDAQPFTHGQCGFFSSGKSLTVTHVSICPLMD